MKRPRNGEGPDESPLFERVLEVHAVEHPDRVPAVLQLAAVADTTAEEEAPRKRRRTFTPRHFLDIEINLKNHYLVKGVIDRGSLCVIYGQSNSSKSFLGVEMARCVASGLPFFGKRVDRGPVVYVAC